MGNFFFYKSVRKRFRLGIFSNNLFPARIFPFFMLKNISFQISKQLFYVCLSDLVYNSLLAFYGVVSRL